MDAKKQGKRSFVNVSKLETLIPDCNLNKELETFSDYW